MQSDLQTQINQISKNGSIDEALNLLNKVKPTVRSTGGRGFYVDAEKDSVSMKKLISCVEKVFEREQKKHVNLSKNEEAQKTLNRLIELDLEGSDEVSGGNLVKTRIAQIFGNFSSYDPETGALFMSKQSRLSRLNYTLSPSDRKDSFVAGRAALLLLRQMMGKNQKTEQIRKVITDYQQGKLSGEDFQDAMNKALLKASAKELKAVRDFTTRLDVLIGGPWTSYEYDEQTERLGYRMKPIAPVFEVAIQLRAFKDDHTKDKIDMNQYMGLLTHYGHGCMKNHPIGELTLEEYAQDIKADLMSVLKGKAGIQGEIELPEHVLHNAIRDHYKQAKTYMGLQNKTNSLESMNQAELNLIRDCQLLAHDQVTHLPENQQDVDQKAQIDRVTTELLSDWCASYGLGKYTGPSMSEVKPYLKPV